MSFDEAALTALCVEVASDVADVAVLEELSELKLVDSFGSVVGAITSVCDGSLEVVVVPGVTEAAELVVD